MITPTNELLTELSTVNFGPCLSLYMHTHQSHPENKQDPIRFQNLVKQLEASLMQKYSPQDVSNLLAPFKGLQIEQGFWEHTSNGLAVFSTAGLFKTVAMPLPVNDLAIAADSFHTKPLRRYLQSAGRYNVVAVTLTSARVFQGNQHALTELYLPGDFPTTLEKALGYELTEKHSTVASYGGIGAGSVSMHHGDGGRKDQLEDDTKRFFRIVSKAVYDNYSKDSGLPLILAALPEHHNVFNKTNKNPHLLPGGITVNPTFLSTEDLAKLAWEVMEPHYILRLKDLAAAFEKAKATNKGSDNISEIAKAAAEGRVDTLIIEAGWVLPGKITNAVTGTIDTGDLTDPDTDDLFDDIAALVTKKGGSVIVVPRENMPTITGIAAIFRY